MLTEIQQKICDEFLYSVEKKENNIISSDQRRIGKTTILNELAFDLQALGYRVFVYTSYKDQDYYADGFIYEGLHNFRGLKRDYMVVIVDELNITSMRESNNYKELLEYCEYGKIPVVGYI